MNCECRKGAVTPGCSRHSVADRVSSPAFYEERIRLLEEQLRRYESAFTDAMIALCVHDEAEADRLRERWFDTETV